MCVVAPLLAELPSRPGEKCGSELTLFSVAGPDIDSFSEPALRPAHRPNTRPLRREGLRLGELVARVLQPRQCAQGLPRDGRPAALVTYSGTRECRFLVRRTMLLQ